MITPKVPSVDVRVLLRLFETNPWLEHEILERTDIDKSSIVVGSVIGRIHLYS